jgi:hypothetical protein
MFSFLNQATDLTFEGALELLQKKTKKEFEIIIKAQTTQKLAMLATETATPRHFDDSQYTMPIVKKYSASRTFTLAALKDLSSPTAETVTYPPEEYNLTPDAWNDVKNTLIAFKPAYEAFLKTNENIHKLLEFILAEQRIRQDAELAADTKARKLYNLTH